MQAQETSPTSSIEILLVLILLTIGDLSRSVDTSNEIRQKVDGVLIDRESVLKSSALHRRSGRARRYSLLAQ
jgi:hypothetical protein